MKILPKYRWPILIVLLIAGIWYALSPQNAPSGAQTVESIQTPDARSKTDRTRETPAPNSPPQRPDATTDRLAGVQSPIAKRYLRFMLAGGHLDGESHDQSIVNNAFKQAWGVVARIELTEAQQDRLAEFLLEEDWSKWSTMNRTRVEKWAKEHLSREQTDALLAFIEESKQGDQNLSDLRMELKKKEYGVRTEPEAFTAEMRDSARIAELLAKDTNNLSEAEVAKMRAELGGLMNPANAGKGDADAGKVAESRKDEHAAQFFHLLADRIPMTEEQQLAIYGALRSGASSPTNPYDYQTRPADQIEAEVKSTTDWMGKVLTKEQYETYLRHYLAEIEMIRFQVSL